MHQMEKIIICISENNKSKILAFTISRLNFLVRSNKAQNIAETRHIKIDVDKILSKFVKYSRGS